MTVPVKITLICEKEARTSAVLGVVGALIFLFAFPKGSISTLVHEVLCLPGPGAGIGLVLGPFLIVVAVVSSLLSRGSGGALFASLMFAVAYALIVHLFRIPTSQKGVFGSSLFIAAVIVFSVVTEAAMALGKPLSMVWRCMLCGAVANVVLLVIYWTVIFPGTAGWIRWSDAPVLVGLCFVCGLVSGCIAWGISRPLSKTIAIK